MMATACFWLLTFGPDLLPECSVPCPHLCMTSVYGTGHFSPGVVFISPGNGKSQVHPAIRTGARPDCVIAIVRLPNQRFMLTFWQDASPVLRPSTSQWLRCASCLPQSARRAKVAHISQ